MWGNITKNMCRQNCGYIMVQDCIESTSITFVNSGDFNQYGQKSSLRCLKNEAIFLIAALKSKLKLKCYPILANLIPPLIRATIQLVEG